MFVIIEPLKRKENIHNLVMTYSILVTIMARCSEAFLKLGPSKKEIVIVLLRPATLA